MLLNSATNWVLENKGDLIWFNAREKALRFYERNGFEKRGSAFEISDIGTHFLFYRYL